MTECATLAIISWWRSKKHHPSTNPSTSGVQSYHFWNFNFLRPRKLFVPLTGRSIQKLMGFFGRWSTFRIWEIASFLVKHVCFRVRIFWWERRDFANSSWNLEHDLETTSAAGLMILWGTSLRNGKHSCGLWHCTFGDFLNDSKNCPAHNPCFGTSNSASTPDIFWCD